MIKIAKNLLEDKTCDSCEYINRFKYILYCDKFRNASMVDKPRGLPEERTCEYWKEDIQPKTIIKAKRIVKNYRLKNE